jgi:hypothetical protein
MANSSVSSSVILKKLSGRFKKADSLHDFPFCLNDGLEAELLGASVVD